MTQPFVELDREAWAGLASEGDAAAPLPLTAEEFHALRSLGDEVDLDDPDVVRTLAAVQVWPITAEIARESTSLDLRSDPADELIAATSVVHNVPLVTRDPKLRASRVVPLLPARG